MVLLIAEDESRVRSVLVNYIQWEAIGISCVYEASNGLDAYALACRIRPDIILSDIRMPKMNGTELAEKYRNVDENCRFIFLSAYTDREYYRIAMHVRAVSYVEKPVEPEKVRQAVLGAITDIRKEKEKIAEKVSAELSREQEEKKRLSEPSSADRLSLVAQVIEFIKRNYSDEHLSIPMIAESLFASANYLSAVFKKEVGTTINHYITDYRISVAKQCLKDASIPMNSIAKMAGYSDAGYFAKVFKHRTGLRPIEYRRRYNEKNADFL